MDQTIQLHILHNTIDAVPSHAVSFYAADVDNPLGFSKFDDILIKDNIFSQCVLGVCVDYDGLFGNSTGESSCSGRRTDSNYQQPGL